MALSRDAILGAADMKTVTVAVPEWGGDVIVSTMSGSARDEWEQSLIQRKGNKTEPNLANIRARLVAATAVDEAGKRLFTEADVNALGKKSAAALERICKAAQKLNGIGDSELEDLQGN
jgi:hypothetical protein